MADVRYEIEQRNREFCEAFDRGDAAGAAAVYTDDAQVLPPDGALVIGRQAIEQFWKGMMAMGARSVQPRTETVEVSGNLAYEIGSATLQIHPEGGEPITRTVKYVVILKEDADGSWRWAVDIWNGKP